MKIEMRVGSPNALETKVPKIAPKTALQIHVLLKNRPQTPNGIRMYMYMYVYRATVHIHVHVRVQCTCTCTFGSCEMT